MSHSHSPEAVKELSPARRDEQSAGQLDQVSAEERDLLQEILRALRSMRYGSVLMTVHDGRLVEIQKTERFRRAVGKGKD